MALDQLMTRELERFRAEHPRSLALAEQAKHSLLGGVPMHWMVRWPGGFPVFAAEAEGARFTDVDGHEYVDFCLGDTGAMTGHAPEPALRAIAAQAPRGITLMLPSEDALWVGEEMARRFGLPYWQFALTATDANRFALRIARAVTGPAEDPRVQLVLPRHGRRDVRHARARRQRRRARGHGRPVRAGGGHHARGRVQRRRGARARARPRRRRLRAGRARADQHRHRAAGARLPRRAARGDAPHGHAADHRRDAHDLRRAGRLHGRPRPRARHPHDRQAARRRRPGRRLRVLGGGGGAGQRRDRGAARRHRRHRRHARRQRALARRDARDARRGPDRGGVRGA